MIPLTPLSVSSTISIVGVVIGTKNPLLDDDLLPELPLLPEPDELGAGGLEHKELSIVNVFVQLTAPWLNP